MLQLTQNPLDEMLMLRYRGVNYTVPQHRPAPVFPPRRTAEQMAALVGKELIYRGVHYRASEPSETANSEASAIAVKKQLSYRGASYEIAIRPGFLPSLGKG